MARRLKLNSKSFANILSTFADQSRFMTSSGMIDSPVELAGKARLLFMFFVSSISFLVITNVTQVGGKTCSECVWVQSTITSTRLNRFNVLEQRLAEWNSRFPFLHHTTGLRLEQRVDRSMRDSSFSLIQLFSLEWRNVPECSVEWWRPVVWLRRSLSENCFCLRNAGTYGLMTDTSQREEGFNVRNVWVGIEAIEAD